MIQEVYHEGELKGRNFTIVKERYSPFIWNDIELITNWNEFFKNQNISEKNIDFFSFNFYSYLIINQLNPILNEKFSPLPSLPPPN